MSSFEPEPLAGESSANPGDKASSTPDPESFPLTHGEVELVPVDEGSDTTEPTLSPDISAES